MATWGRQVISISLLGVAACSSSGIPKAAAPPSAPPTTAPRARSTTTTSTSTSIPPYSFDDSVPPPKLVNTGTDYKKILQSLLDYSSWIFAHRPDLSFEAKITAPGSATQAGGSKDIRILRHYDRRLYETNGRRPTLEILSATAGYVAAGYTQDITQQAVVDKHGTIVSRLAPGLTTYNVLMVKLLDDRWYLASVEKRKDLKDVNVNL